ncbi:MAG: hypothetical protein Q8L51_03885 [Candidatus Amesbacteria bacterium]|nr:hypothetical protein [Candidatus Amesbacteria bacterium]
MTRDFSKHLSIHISRDLLNRSSFASQVISNIQLPDRQFPKSVFIHDDNQICLGYYVSYEDTFTDEQIFLLCKNNQWHNLVNKIADYLIIFIDCINHRINILISQSGKFPCYYSLEDDQIVISTSFHLVDKNLKKRTLNTEDALEFLSWGQGLYPREETLFKQIRQLPPATLLTINSNFTVTVKPLFQIEEILENVSGSPFLNIEDFKKELLTVGKTVVASNLKSLGNLEFSSDISSGFDSSLVTYWLKKTSTQPFTCFSMYSPLIYEDSNPEIVDKFCKFHELTNKFVDISNQFPFVNLTNPEYAKHGFYITDYGFEKLIYGYNLLSNSGKKEIGLFTGHGGDEWYYYSTLENTLRYGVQSSYFNSIKFVKSWLNLILTTKGVDILLDKKRFLQKRIYPSPVFSSVFSLGQMYFPLFWESGVWPLTPFSDPRLTDLGRRMPKNLLNEEKIKFKLWSPEDGIFVKEQFTPKSGPEKLDNRYITEKVDLVISILKKSVLGELGLIKNTELIKELETKNLSYIANDDVLLDLQALIQLEIFLQKSDL